MKYSALERFEAGLWTLDEPRRTATTGNRGIEVVPQSRIADRPLQPASIRQPRQVPGRQLEELGERPNRRQLRHWPASAAHRQLGDQPATNPRSPSRILGSRTTLQRQGDKRRELSRPISRRSVIGGEYFSRDRQQPRRPAVQRSADTSDHRPLIPDPGQKCVSDAA
jgi:hypothetical protein